MSRPGPVLENLTHRLADTPADFLAPPLCGGAGEVHVAALVNDLLFLHGSRASAQALAPFASSDAPGDANRLALTMILVWLLADECFVHAGCAPGRLLAILFEQAAELADGTSAHAFVHDPERREELARIALAHLDMRPDGESAEQAADRLSAISGSERRKLVAATRAAAQRSREVREALARKAAQEAADKWTRD